jgi:hypothetical protein
MAPSIDFVGFVRWYEHYKHEPKAQEVLNALVQGPGTLEEKLEWAKGQAEAAKAGK